MKLILTLTTEEAVPGVPTATDIGHPELAKFTLNRGDWWPSRYASRGGIRT